MVPRKEKSFLIRHAIFILASLIFVLVPSSLLAFTAITSQQKTVTKDYLQKIASQSAEINRLNNEDLRQTNKQVSDEINLLKENYKSTLNIYEKILNLKSRSGSNTSAIDSSLASLFNFLAHDDLANFQDSYKKISELISKEESRLSSAKIIPANAPDISEAPASGYRRQKVTIDGVSFLVDVVAADLNTTRVIVDTASDSTCTQDCPVLPLASYVSRSGAYAGVNGTYFCPETYPTCADKKNSFDILVMNKNKVYFNSDNNVYSTVPAAIFSGSSARFVTQTLEWGRDTSVDAVIANRPLLVLDGSVRFGSGGEEKETIRSSRSFLGATGSTGYIGVVHNATVAESAKVIFTMGIKNAINLDSGGSTALWSGSYRVGPGRNLPNVVLFVKK